jgi:hypothetical protein
MRFLGGKCGKKMQEAEARNLSHLLFELRSDASSMLRAERWPLRAPGMDGRVEAPL